MSRSLLVLLPAALLVGCQSPAFQTSGYGAAGAPGGPGVPAGMGPVPARQYQPYPGMGPVGGAPGPHGHTAAKPPYGAPGQPPVQPVGWKPMEGPWASNIEHTMSTIDSHIPGRHPGAGYPVSSHAHGMAHPKNTMALAVPSTAAFPGAGMGVPAGPQFVTGRTQVRFVRPEGMKIGWQVPTPGPGPITFTPPQLVAPARYNFLQGQMYRLKITELRPGIDLYPTLEVYPSNYKTAAYLNHNAVPIVFTDEDIEQVLAGNYVTKVIYLPDPEFQELAITIEEIVSTRLDPGVDPVQEAHRRGSILAVIRLGSVDLEMPHSPPLAGPPMHAPTGMAPPVMQSMPGAFPPGAPAPRVAPVEQPGTLPAPTLEQPSSTFEQDSVMRNLPSLSAPPSAILPPLEPPAPPVAVLTELPNAN